MNNFYSVFENSDVDGLAPTAQSIRIPKDDYSLQSENSSDDWEKAFDYFYSKLSSGGEISVAPENIGCEAKAPESSQTRAMPEGSLGQSGQVEALKQTSVSAIPLWAWLIGTLLAMFLLEIVLLLFVHFISFSMRDFELSVKGVPEGGQVFVDGMRWSLTSGDGTYRLGSLAPGEERVIEIRGPGLNCKPQKVVGEPGEMVQLIPQCTENPPKNIGGECQNIKKDDYQKASKCAVDALHGLKSDFSADDLLKALNLYIINFESGKYDIKADDKAFLQKASQYLKKLPADVVIEIGGHTDNVGGKAANQTLSENRAQAVKTALVSFGVKGSSLQVKGYGDSKPKAGLSNETEEGRFLNRRIEYSVKRKWEFV